MAQRCLIISYYFPPIGGGGVQRIVKLIKFLHRSDWNFTVLTADNDVISLPRDQLLLKEIDDNTKIIRIPIKDRTKKTVTGLKSILPSRAGFLQRWISAFFYIPDIRKQWLKKLHPVLLEEIKRNKYDCIFITAPPYSLAVYAAQLTDELCIPVVLDMRDPWTSNPYKIHPTPYHLRKDLKIELTSISHIAYGVSAYKNLIKFYKERIRNFEIALWKVIPNGYDDEDFKLLKNETLNNGKFNIAFSGTFYSHINNPTPLFKAISRLNKNIKNKILFHHIGNTQINLFRMISKYNLESNVQLWNYLSHQECIEKLNKMDALCFILDDRNKNSVNTIGGKVYEYLRLKKPILALVPENGEAAELINNTKSGKVISPHNMVEICKTLEEWITGKTNFEFIGIETYSRENQARHFLDLLNRACNRG